MLLHASADRDMQVRRAYGVLGGMLLAVGVILPWLPYKGVLGGLFPYGLGLLGLALPLGDELALLVELLIRVMQLKRRAKKCIKN